MGLFSSSKSSSATSIYNYDDDNAASEGSNIVTGIAAGASVTVGSDELAGFAIDKVVQNSKDTLTLATDFLSQAFTKVLTQSDSRAAAAESNVAANQSLTRDLLQKEQETADDRLIKLVTILGLTAAGIFYFTRKK